MAVSQNLLHHASIVYSKESFSQQKCMAAKSSKNPPILTRASPRNPKKQLRKAKNDEKRRKSPKMGEKGGKKLEKILQIN